MNERNQVDKLSSGASKVADRVIIRKGLKSSAFSGKCKMIFTPDEANCLASLVDACKLESNQAAAKPQDEQNDIQAQCMNYSTALKRRSEGLPVDENALFYQASRIGQLFQRSLLFDRALDYYRQALRFKNKTISKESPEIQVTFADILFNVGIIHTQPESSGTDRREKSLEAFNLCLDLRRRCCGASHPSIASALYKLGVIYSSMDEHASALDLLLESLSILMFASPDSDELRDVWLAIGKAHQALGHAKEAESSFQEVALNVGKIDPIGDDKTPARFSATVDGKDPL
jgi:tetratricopeptide (TPR) repeat protein